MKWAGYRSHLAKKKAIIVVAYALIVIISLGHLTDGIRSGEIKPVAAGVGLGNYGVASD
jgi:hypothetical protein